MGSPVGAGDDGGVGAGDDGGVGAGDDGGVGAGDDGKKWKKPVKIWSVCHDDYLCCVEIVREI